MSTGIYIYVRIDSPWYRREEKRVLARLASAKYLRSLIILGTEGNFDTEQEGGRAALDNTCIPQKMFSEFPHL